MVKLRIKDELFYRQTESCRLNYTVFITLYVVNMGSKIEKKHAFKLHTSCRIKYNVTGDVKYL